jgi:translation elongation factor EF-1beta
LVGWLVGSLIVDLKVLEAEIRKIELVGLEWKAAKLEEIAYGIQKIVINAHIEDDKVSTDAIEEKILELEDYVQSVDIAAFNKLCMSLLSISSFVLLQRQQLIIADWLCMYIEMALVRSHMLINVPKILLPPPPPPPPFVAYWQ